MKTAATDDELRLTTSLVKRHVRRKISGDIVFTICKRSCCMLKCFGASQRVSKVLFTSRTKEVRYDCMSTLDSHALNLKERTFKRAVGSGLQQL